MSPRRGATNPRYTYSKSTPHTTIIHMKLPNSTMLHNVDFWTSGSRLKVDEPNMATSQGFCLFLYAINTREKNQLNNRKSYKSNALRMR